MFKKKKTASKMKVRIKALFTTPQEKQVYKKKVLASVMFTFSLQNGSRRESSVSAEMGCGELCWCQGNPAQEAPAVLWT